MRFLVLIVAAIAGLKVWTQDRLYRSIMQDALMQAYRERAMQTCQKEAARPGRHTVTVWTPATDAGAEIVIGNAKTDVAIWDYQNPLWDVRFRHPHVVLSGVGTKTHCAFDVAAGLATIETN